MRCPKCMTAELHVDLVRKTGWCPACRITWTKMDLLRLTPAERLKLTRPIATPQQADEPTVVEG